MFNRKYVLVTVLILTLFLYGGSPASAAVIDRIVAVVNDDIITLSELQEENLPLINQIKESYGGEERRRRIQDVEKQTLDLLVEKKLMLLDAKKESLTVTPADVNAAIEEIKRNNKITTDEELRQGLTKEHLTYETFRKRLEEQLIILRISTRKVKAKVIITDEDIKKYYQDHPAEFEITPEYKIRLIYFKLGMTATDEEAKKTQDRAQEILNKLRAGADFGDLAKLYSDDVTAAVGGDLGYVKAKDMVSELEKACQRLEKGKVSDIIKTSKGLHILKLEDKRPAGVKPLTEVSSSVKETLTEKIYEQKHNEWIKDLRSKAYIEIKL